MSIIYTIDGYAPDPVAEVSITTIPTQVPNGAEFNTYKYLILLQ